jgi:hypothetical protein
MSEQQNRIRIELTPEQRAQIKEAAGQDLVALEFSPDELEQRIAPSVTFNSFNFTKHIDVASP